MNFALLIPILGVSIPIVAIIAATVNKWLQIKEKQIEALNSETAEKAARYAAQTERLEQRMRVLERIITDKGFEVSQQIEDLRDKPLN
jgi:chemotaxis signal transduction protein